MNTKQKRVAIVTGASRGIGRAIAVSLGSQGFSVLINYNSNVDAAKEAAQQVEAAGGKAAIVQADIGNLADHERVLKTAIDTFGPVDTLVNNAGIAPKVRADLLDAGPESFDDLITTNLRGPYFLSQRLAKHMIENRKGYGETPVSIINISSISAYTASINRGDYCVSKAGIAMMTQLFASRLADDGIRVYEVRPGVIATDMTGPVKAKYDKLILEDGITPIKRWGQPDDIGKAVLAIALGYLPFSTGEVVNVDGGFHMRRL
jgi:3-oxoacyl-[acyl-carrier protein] reductase